MVLTRLLLLVGLMLGALTLAPPAASHEKHKQAQVEAQARAQAGAAAGTVGAAPASMAEHMAGMAQEEAPQTFWQRLTGWMGRMHPFAVHFPIALYPIAFVALLLARRRGGPVELIRAIVIVAGVASIGAAALGWLNAGLIMADSDVVLAWHRWIGTALGLVGGITAVWAWRRRDSVDGVAMAASLGAITLALLVQGWLGGAITHGMGHMMF